MLRTIAMTCWTGGSRFAGWMPRYVLNMWSLAAWQSRAVFPASEGYRLVLNTDAAGAALLIDGLALPFDEVITDDLPALPLEMGWLWPLAKLSTYARLAREGRAFLHQDADFVLYRKPRAEVLEAAAFAQSIGPVEGWLAALHRGLSLHPPALFSELAGTCNAGLLGGNDTEALHRYAADSLAAGVAPENRSVLFGASQRGEHWPGCLLEEAALVGTFGDRLVPWVADGALSNWDRAGGMHLAAGKEARGDRALVEIQLHTLHPAAYRRAWAVSLTQRP